MCIKQIGKDGLMAYLCVEENTFIVTSALRNEVLKALLGFIGKKC